MKALLAPLFNTEQSRSKYIFVAAMYSTLPALALGYLLLFLFPNAKQPEFALENEFIFLSDTIIFAPILETLLMWPLIVLLSKYIASSARVAVFSALVWAILHGLSAPVWAVTIFFSFIVFSICFIEWKKKSTRHAFWMTFGVHATQNTIASV